jgi:hypothetical protein
MTARADERRWWLEALRLHGGRMSRALRSVFEAIGAELLDGLDRFSRAEIVAEVRRRLSPNRWAKELRVAAESALLAAATAAAVDELLRHAPGSARRMFAATSARVRVLVGVVLASDSWRHIIRTLRRDVLRKLALAFAAGLAVVAAVNAVATVFRPTTLQRRSDRVALIEQHGVLNGGKEAARVELFREGHPLDKVWRTMRDDRVRHSHQLADGQTVPAGGRFVVGGERCRYPGDFSLSLAERAGCRCYASGVPVTAKREPVGVVG